MKILVVVDPIIREAIAVGIGLQWQEATVITAATGDEGLRRFEEDEPDVVLLDVMLPGRTGFAPRLPAWRRMALEPGSVRAGTV